VYCSEPGTFDDVIGGQALLRAFQTEETMRKFFLSVATFAAILVGGLAAAPRAEAMPAAPGIAVPVTHEGGLLRKTAYTCRPIWRCGRFGCGWRQVCYWAPARYSWPHYYGPRWRYGQWLGW
jgi:hypothetical protein